MEADQDGRSIAKAMSNLFQMEMWFTQSGTLHMGYHHCKPIPRTRAGRQNVKPAPIDENVVYIVGSFTSYHHCKPVNTRKQTRCQTRSNWRKCDLHNYSRVPYGYHHCKSTPRTRGHRPRRPKHYESNVNSVPIWWNNAKDESRTRCFEMHDRETP